MVTSNSVGVAATNRVAPRCVRPIALLGIAGMLVSGCSTIDRFGGRVTTVNAAASEAKSRNIMTNVMRAAYREPLQFSDVSTVAGTGQLTGSLLTNAPIKISPVGDTRVLALNPTLSAQGTSQFNVTNLNTQEFYNGLQSPVSLQQIANLINAGYDPTLVLFLTVSELNVTTYEGKEKVYVTLQNDPDHPIGYGTTYNALLAMVQMGFSEQAVDGDAYGPEMTGGEVRNSRFVAAIQATAGTDLTLKKNKNNGYQFIKKGGYASCFDLTKADPSKLTGISATSSVQPAIDAYRSFTDAQRFNGNQTLVLASFEDDQKHKVAVRGAEIRIPIDNLCGYEPRAGVPPINDDQKPDFKLKTRSVEGIFQFLGAIVRRQTGIGIETGSINPLETGPGTVAFKVSEGQPAVSAVSAWFRDKPYSIASDPTGADQSTQVLQILTDLLALQSSAKNIPSPGLITVIGR